MSKVIAKMAKRSELCGRPENSQTKDQCILDRCAVTHPFTYRRGPCQSPMAIHSNFILRECHATWTYERATLASLVLFLFILRFGIVVS